MSQDNEDRGLEDGNGEEQNETTQQLMRRLITALEQKAGDGENFIYFISDPFPLALRV